MSAVGDPSLRVDRAARVEGIVQVVIMLAIGGAAGAASFTHVYDVAAAHGQPGWLAWADAIVLELMSIAGGLELRRRKRAAAPVGFPATVLVVAVVLSMGAQVVEAEPSPIGWIAAVLPAAGFLAMVKIALGRTGATPAPAHHPVRSPVSAVPADSGRSGTVPGGPGRAADDEHAALPDPGVGPRGEQPASSGVGVADDLRALVPVAVSAATELAVQRRPLSRETLAESLRRQGHAMSNARASALVKLVRDQVRDGTGPGPPPPAGEDVPVLTGLPSGQNVPGGATRPDGPVDTVDADAPT